MPGSFNPDDLDPGIRETVQLLRSKGFRTTDSGDGSKAGVMEHAMPFRHVFGTLPHGSDIRANGDRLARLLPGWHVEVTYSPASRVTIFAVMEVTP